MTLLAVELRESTKSIHAEAERAKFMNALEKALDLNKDNAQLSLVYFPEELFRKKSLEQDLEFYNGPEWREMLTPITPAQQAYISAIERCSTSETPELLISHAYVRYLGDLSGGQILAKRLQKFNDIPEGKGVAFYQFDLVEEPDKFKEMFRKRLNQVEVSDELREQLLEEARVAFQKNIGIFQEFDGELEGLPMTRREQLAFEKEKQLAAETANKRASLNSQKPGFLASLNPINLWSSLVGTQTVDA
ncbi:heme oxygenase (decycling) 1 [Mortierella sp. AM989]|nr:heme oxygenase (decycling) 1 [Mortierella sp. AM989]